MSSSLKDNPLLLPISFWLIGLILFHLFTISIFCLIGSLLIVLFLLFSRKTRLIALCLSFALLACFRFYVFSFEPENNISYAFREKSLIKQKITGKIISKVNEKEGLYSFVLEMNTIKNIPIKGNIKFYTRSKGLEYGDIVESVAELKLISAPTNPDAFSYKDYLLRQKIYASGFSLSPVNVLSKEPEFFTDIIITIGSRVSSLISKRFDENSAFIKAIFLGDKSELGDYRENMTRAGLSHLLAVSGLHVGLISLIILLILNTLIPNKNIVRIVTIIILLFYAALCNWSPSVFRAAVMIALYLIGTMLQRQISSLNILFLSAFIITLINPLQLFSIGFQLSYIAVFTLLIILPKYWNFLIFKLHLNDKKMLKFFAGTITTTLILSVYLGPLTAFYFHQLNFNGIIGNLIGIPAMGIILPLSILIIFFPIQGFILNCYRNSFHFLMKGFDLWVDFSGGLPLHFTFISINIFQLLILYLILFTIPFLLNKKGILKYVMFLMIPFIFLISANLWNEDRLKITFFDCGLGDMTLLELPDNTVIMVDCGPPAKSSGSFKHSALPYLQKQGLKCINYLVITHAHNDHYGGIEDVFKYCEVDSLIVTDELQKRKLWNWISKLTEPKTGVITISDTCSFYFDNVRIKVLHPDRDYKDDNINNVSIVMKLDFEEFALLLNGDLEVEGEEYLLHKYPSFLPADVTKVGHHGSKTSSSKAYLNTIDPMLAFIPAPTKNRFGFPHKITLDKYSYLNEMLMVAGNDGALTVITDGQTAELRTWKSNKYHEFDVGR